MARPVGVEPATFWSVVKCSIQLSYERTLNGGFGRNWTTDTRIFSPLLYRLSYEAKKMAVPTGFGPAIFCVTGRRDNHYTTEPLVAEDGFEPSTFGLWAQRATRLLHSAIKNIINWRRKRDSNPRAVADLPVFKTGPFNQTWVFLLFFNSKYILTQYQRKSQYFFLLTFFSTIWTKSCVYSIPTIWTINYLKW